MRDKAGRRSHKDHGNQHQKSGLEHLRYLFISPLRHQVAEPKGVATNDFATGKSYGFFEHWSIEHEGMKLAVFAARINSGREVRKKFFVDHPANERGIKFRRVHTNQN